jgi:hypothetical protein
MAGRPCNPGSDLKWLWQALLPGTAFPQCGVPERSETTTADRPTGESERKDQAAPSFKFRRDA